MLMVSMIASQLWVGYKSDSAKVAEYREKIGLDYSMPDYSVTYNAYSCPMVTGTCPLSRGDVGSFLRNLKIQINDIRY